MARRSSTIGNDPLEAVSLHGTARPAAASAAAGNDRAKAQPGLTGEPPAAPSAREAKAMAAVRSSFGWSTAAGLVPVPWLDLAAIIGVQVKMLQEIARIYGQPYPAKMARPLIVALLGGGGGYLLAGPAASLVKAIPVVGPLAGLLTLPALSTASCYATGRVFIQHFESGGTFLDFDPTKVRAYYAEQFSAAKAGL